MNYFFTFILGFLLGMMLIMGTALNQELDPERCEKYRDYILTQPNGAATLCRLGDCGPLHKQAEERARKGGQG